MKESEFMNQHVNIYLLLVNTVTISLTKTELLICKSECFLNAAANDACPFLQLIISVLNYNSVLLMLQYVQIQHCQIYVTAKCKGR